MIWALNILQWLVCHKNQPNKIIAVQKKKKEKITQARLRMLSTKRVYKSYI